MKNARKSGRLYGKPSADFMRVCHIWQSGDISSAEAAKKLGVSRYTFYCWAAMSGIAEFPRTRCWRRIEQPESFSRIYDAWKSGKMHWSTATKELGVSQSTFYSWVSVHGNSPKQLKLHSARNNMKMPEDFPRFYEQWKSGKLNYAVILRTYHVGRSTFYRWSKEYENSYRPISVYVKDN